MYTHENGQFLALYDECLIAVQTRVMDNSRDLYDLQARLVKAGRQDLAAALDMVIQHNARTVVMFSTLRHSLIQPTEAERNEVAGMIADYKPDFKKGQPPADEGGVWPFQAGEA